MEYNIFVRQGKMTPLDLVEMRSQVDARLAEQGIEPLHSLESTVSRPIAGRSDVNVERELGFMPFEQEMEYLGRLDAKLSMNGGGLPADPRHRDLEQEKHYADLTPRELERKTEFENPQSQHNWLKTHTKVLGNDGDGDDTESLASHDTGNKPPNKRKSAGKGNLAKQVGDRAIERAREGSTAVSNDEDELASDVGPAGAPGSASGRKRTRDPDGAYRLKGSKPAAKGKRKRSGEDSPAGGAASGKKAKVEGGGGTPGAGNGGGTGGVMGMG